MKIRLSVILLILGVFYGIYKLYSNFNSFNYKLQVLIIIAGVAISLGYIVFCLINFKLSKCNVRDFPKFFFNYYNILMISLTLLDDIIPRFIMGNIYKVRNIYRQVFFKLNKNKIEKKFTTDDDW